MEYITSESSPVVLLVELTRAQSIYVGTVMKDYVDLHPQSQYNAMLDCFLRWSGRQKMVMIPLTICKNTTETTMVSMLTPGESNPIGNGITQVYNNIWKMTIPNRNNGVLDVTYGIAVPVQHICNWSFKK